MVRIKVAHGTTQIWPKKEYRRIAAPGSLFSPQTPSILCQSLTGDAGWPCVLASIEMSAHCFASWCNECCRLMTEGRYSCSTKFFQLSGIEVLLISCDVGQNASTLLQQKRLPYRAVLLKNTPLPSRRGWLQTLFVLFAGIVKAKVFACFFQLLSCFCRKPEKLLISEKKKIFDLHNYAILLLTHIQRNSGRDVQPVCGNVRLQAR